MKKWLITAVTLTFALATAGMVAGYALTGDSDGDNPEVPDGAAGQVSAGLPTYDEWLDEYGDGAVATSIDDIDPNECNLIHNINACTPEQLAEAGMDPTAGSIAVDEPYPAGLPLENIEWELKSYGRLNEAQPVLKGSEITATFGSRIGSVRGSAGCNRYSGSYEAGDGSLGVGPIAATEMGCMGQDPYDEDYGQHLMEQEQTYLEALGAAQSF